MGGLFALRDWLIWLKKYIIVIRENSENWKITEQRFNQENNERNGGGAGKENWYQKNFFFQVSKKNIIKFQNAYIYYLKKV